MASREPRRVAPPRSQESRRVRISRRDSRVRAYDRGAHHFGISDGRLIEIDRY